LLDVCAYKDDLINCNVFTFNDDNIIMMFIILSQPHLKSPSLLFYRRSDCDGTEVCAYKEALINSKSKGTTYITTPTTLLRRVITTTLEAADLCTQKTLDVCPGFHTISLFFQHFVKLRAHGIGLRVLLHRVLLKRRPRITSLSSNIHITERISSYLTSKQDSVPIYLIIIF
jgi:hypothetical protein